MKRFQPGERYDVRELPFINALFDGKDRCGVYRLWFERGDAYVGQSRDVVRRFADHRKTWGSDIQFFEFTPVSQNELTLSEQELLAATEKLTSVRNIVWAQRPGGLETMIFNFEDRPSISLPWDRAERIRPEESISGRSWITGDNKWLQWAELAEHPSYAHLLDVIGWYVHETIPDPVRTNELLWVISCLPSTGRRPGHRRLATVSCGHLETLVVEEHRTGGKRAISVRINTEPVANSSERATRSFRELNRYTAYNVRYRIAETTSWAFDLESLRRAITGDLVFSRMPELLESAYKLNVRMMRHSGTIQRKYNNQQLASEVLYSAVSWKDWAHGTSDR